MMSPLNRVTRSTSQPVPYDRLRILIAEDNVINQRVLGRILSRLGVRDFVVVDDGAKAVEEEKARPYHFVLMDMEMPRMDGLEACKLITKRKDHAKVIFVTAHTVADYEARCYDAGGEAFVPKPCRVEIIEQTLQRVIDKFPQILSK